MSDIDYLRLFTRLSGLRLVVRINRVGCANDLARCAHDRLVVKLGELIELMLRGVEAERSLRNGTHPARVAQASEDLYWIEAEFEHRWMSQPHPLLDHLDIDAATREIFDPHSNRWYPLGDCSPFRRDVSDRERCGLPAIINQIELDTGMSFSACRTVYDDTGCEVDDVAHPCLGTG